MNYDKGLSQAAIVGLIVQGLEGTGEVSWVGQLSTMRMTDTRITKYPFLGQVAHMREFVGGPRLEGMNAYEIEVISKLYASEIKVSRDLMRRDQTGEVMRQINELAAVAEVHWAELASELIENGATGLAYDGRAFFATDHPAGTSATQSNSITVDISEIDAKGTVTHPLESQVRAMAMRGVSQIRTMKGDRGELMNVLANDFLVMVPEAWNVVAAEALASPTLPGGGVNPVLATGVTVRVATNPLLGWTDKLAVFRTDAPTGALLRQQETMPEIVMKGEGSDYAYDTNMHAYGVRTWRGMNYGRFQNACLVTAV